MVNLDGKRNILVVDDEKSPFENMGGSVPGIPVASPIASDQEFGSNALDNAKPNRYFGPSVLDRTHQLSFGGMRICPADSN